MLGGRGMEVVYDEESLKNYITCAENISGKACADRQISDHVIECEADAVTDE